MNLNIVSKIFNYLDLNTANKYLKKIDNEYETDYIIKSYSLINKVYFKNMKAKFNNLDIKCGYCNKFLIGDYILKIGLVDCSICNSNKDFTVQLCQSCSKLDLKRGKMKYNLCETGHLIIYTGINFLS